VFIDPAGTARSVNFMYRDGRRKNFYDGKGHMTLSVDRDACRAVLRGARLAHVNLANWARTLLPVAREEGLVIACDIQDVVDPDDAYRRDFVQAADILFFSATNHPDPTWLIQRFRAGRPERVVVAGMGPQGCAVGTADGTRFFPPPPLDWPVVDTNGAGDGLAVGFLDSYVLDGYPAAESAIRGQIAARHTCSLRGTSSGLIDRARLDATFSTVQR
jgi:sugar/nucleoside kinase (ribokinase family)